MKNVLLIAFVLFLVSFGQLVSGRCECTTQICRTKEVMLKLEKKLKRNVAPKSVPVKVLAAAIYEISIKNKISPALVASIVLVESGGIAHAHNKASGDYGLMQINYKTAEAYGFSMTCLRNWRCNLAAGVRILMDINDGNVCRYNIGTGKIQGALLRKCIAYERKLASI